MTSLAGTAPGVVLFPREVMGVVVIPPILPEVTIRHLVIAVVMNLLLGATASALLLVGDVSPTTAVAVEVVIELPRDALLPQPMTTPLPAAAADMVGVAVATTTPLRETALDTTMITEVRMGLVGGITMNPIEDVR